MRLTNGAPAAAIPMDCADLLRLHALAHTLVNGAPLSVSTGDEAIWELADALESELMEIEEGAKRAMKLLRPLLKLAPDE